jgi:hypothetical protein
VTTLRLETMDGAVPLDDWDEDSGTLPISVPSDISPATLRLIANAVSATVERLAADLESIGGKHNVLKGTQDMAARVRSMQALRPQRRVA